MNLKTHILFLLSILITSSSFAQTQDDELKVLSWNIYMLPGIANLSKQIEKSDKRGRAQEIAAYVNQSDFDVVVFQEAFFGPARKIISQQIEEIYPYQYGPFNPGKMTIKASSGIFIVSKTPLEVVGTIKYNTCSGADCFALKGAALLEGTHNGKRFQILGTHLDAGSEFWIKEEQFKMMKTLLDDYKKIGVPQIICGDMNTELRDEANYKFMLETLGVEDIPTAGKEKGTTATDGAIIDYIFIRQNNTSLHADFKEVSWIKAERKLIDLLKGNLSDHLAISATFKW